MAEKSIIISAEEEAILLKPIDEYVGKIQEQIDALRVEGSDKVNSLKNQIAIAKENKNLTKEELNKKIEVVEKELRSCTWRELETNGKFSKNDKLSFITDDMLIVGCDIGSEIHYIRAIDVRGRELSRGAFEFSNTS